MKKINILVAFFAMSATIWAQSPQSISYQAVLRNSNSELIVKTLVGMQISIMQGTETGTPVYIERHTPTTNTNGLISIWIGNGTVVSGAFDTISWGNGPYFIKTETDPLGGTNYTIAGTSQLLSVPYALYAEQARYAYHAGTVTYENKFLYNKMITWQDSDGYWQESFEYWIANLDGTGKQKIPISLPSGRELNDGACITPDGKTLIFSAEDTNGNRYVYSMSLNGSNLKVIISGEDIEPMQAF